MQGSVFVVVSQPILFVEEYRVHDLQDDRTEHLFWIRMTRVQKFVQTVQLDLMKNSIHVLVWRVELLMQFWRLVFNRLFFDFLEVVLPICFKGCIVHLL